MAVILSPMKLIQGLDYKLSTVQTNASNSINPIVSLPILPGVLLNNLMITSGTPLTVSHSLGRPYQIWFVARNNANAVIWESNPTDAATSIILNASANTTISIWIA